MDFPHARTQGQPFELKTGAVVPAALVTGINSELPGNITAQVTQSVYDTAKGAASAHSARFQALRGL